MSSRYNAAKLLFIGLVFHIVFINTVFDCYFTSPVIHGMQSHGFDHAEAKRLVLIVGDGLRADLLFQKNGFPDVENGPDVVAPYIRSIAETRGAFGVSHTRVPTESRPGHVAIIGGMYEDVSAVTKGWKTNPVNFDSVFNQSSATFSFGSPDILPMFAQGATPGKVHAWCYNEEDEDFTKDATALDLWVLENLGSLLANASSDPGLDQTLRSEKVVFFLHLLGLDTTGHSYRPHSREYMENIQVVDDIVKRTEQMISEFYNDEDTSYIFTADHGMSVIGNHGDGDADNTRTPLVAWGKGIRGPLPDSSLTSHDQYSDTWGLRSLLRRDVEQADLATLMASLIGIPIPVNSIGVIPDVDPSKPGYLSPTRQDEDLAHIALVNARAIVEQYTVQHRLKHGNLLLYRPFQPLESLSDSGVPARLHILSKIEHHIRDRKWNDARAMSFDLINTTLEGLHYLQTYQRTLIRSIVTIAYTGWMAYAALFVFRPLDARQPISNSPYLAYLACSVLLGLWSVFAIEKAPWSYYIYVAFPTYFWHEVISEVRSLVPKKKRFTANTVGNIFLWLFRSVVVIGCLLAMVAGYNQREIWSAALVFIGTLWPIFGWQRAHFKALGRKYFQWTLCCLVTAVFPLLDVNKVETLPLILGGGLVMLVASAVLATYITKPAKKDAPVNVTPAGLATLFSSQRFLIGLTMAVTASSVTSLQNKEGLPSINQMAGWAALVSSLAIPFIFPVWHTSVSSKILSIFLALCPCFIILSISVEGLFFAAYSATLYSWLQVETVIRKPEESGASKMNPDDLRIVLFFLLFVQVGFFGTGNVASISSFYLSPVYRLIPIFSPFWMASLLILKILAPYVMLSVVFAAINHALRLPPFSLFLVALMITDVMTLAFFYNVVDTGSWLEIGQTISFFCITSLLALFSGGIVAAGEWVMAGTFTTEHQKAHVE